MASRRNFVSLESSEEKQAKTGFFLFGLSKVADGACLALAMVACGGDNSTTPGMVPGQTVGSSGVGGSRSGLGGASGSGGAAGSAGTVGSGGGGKDIDARDEGGGGGIDARCGGVGGRTSLHASAAG